MAVRRALCGLAVAVAPAMAQTIADYSRAQRAVLENAMAQAARSAGLPASAPAGPASAAAPGGGMPAPSRGVPAPSPIGPDVRVGGVFASRAGAVAEVIVDATAYLLAAGQGVPGTSWRVESVAVDRVVLARQAAALGEDPARPARRVFTLPALRRAGPWD